MGRASKTKHDLDRRHKIEAQRAAARQAELRNRILIAGGAIITVIIVAIALVLIRSSSPPTGKTPASDGPTGAALAATVRDLTTIPASVLDRAGGGTLATADIGSTTAVGGGYLTPVTGTRLTKNGKPEVFYLGADFCPYCAAVRWPLIVALSRFGTFTGLTTVRSGVANGAGQAEIYPASPTWTFVGSSYASKYLTFTPVETNSSIPDKATGGYTTLQTLTADQQALAATYDQGGGIPFIDIGNAYVQLSTLAPYGPQDLAGKTWAQLTAAISDPSSALGKNIAASANYLTAAICTQTGNQPATACTPAVRALQPRLGSR
jgi:thiol-disulfide isomerase/thioredoxin